MPKPSTPNLRQNETAVLTLNRFLPYQLNQIAEMVSRSFSTIYADRFGITIPEWRVVATLGEHQAMTARDIGKATAMHKTKVSRAVVSLESKGYLHRIQNPDDQREQTLRLNENGMAMYKELVPQAKAYSDRLQDALTPEQRIQLNDIFDRLHDAARSEGTDHK